ncbi:MAG: urate hydroxylase PuuD [Gemmatimonadota bacterium]|nr:urate hydroxylase PuuD [Gemmatimonadota bacterium]
MAFVLEWLELAVRWVHVIAGIAWIGASFYFNWLNDRLTPPRDAEPGVVGELWSIHGGGFYRAMKYETVPRSTLTELHWFKWEAYLTWLTGFSLLVLVYYLGADAYLIDPGVSPISPVAAIAVGLAVLLLGWLVYNRLCRTSLADRSGLFAVLGLVVVALAAFGLSRVLGARAAYMHIGAMIGTIMAANVFFVIIPAHVELVEALEESREPEPSIGTHAAMRSRHNNYFTLPVLFVMISSHYPITYGHAGSWAILAGLFIVGALTRHGFNVRNSGRGTGLIFPVAAIAMLALAFVSASGGRSGVSPAGGEAVTYDRVREIVVARCLTCHAEQPASTLFATPPGGILLETQDQVVALSDRIRAVSVETRVMPLGNLTGMTDDERAELGRWIADGSPTAGPR